MKLAIHGMIAAGLLLSADVMSAESLVRNAHPEAEIVVDCACRNKEACPVEFAAKELQGWIRKITGAELPVRNSVNPEKLQIVLGTPALSKLIQRGMSESDIKAIGQSDGFSIRRAGKTVRIAGTVPKGVLNGVYQFLNDNTDIVFVRPLAGDDGFGTIHGSTGDLELKQKDVLRVPAFDKYRYYSAHTPIENLWQTRLMNLPMSVLSFQQENHRENEYRSWGEIFIEGRPSINAILPMAEYTKSHPEYYPLRKGKRTWNFKWDTFLCWTNPGALKAFTGYFLKNIEHGVQNGIGIFDLPQGDSDLTCECENCMKDVVINGKTVASVADYLGKNPNVPKHMSNFQSTRYFLFMNEVAKAVKAKYPNVRLRGMAYWTTRIPPGFVLEDNIDIVWCPYKKDMRWPITDPSQKLDRYNYPDTFDAWKKVCRGAFYLYEYHFCTQPALLPVPISDVIREDLKFYHTANLKGVYFDSNGWDSDNEKSGFNDAGVKWPRSSTYDASAIEMWVTSRLMWDFSLDPEQLRDEFCRRAYREAAGEMREFFRLTRNGWNQIKLPLHWDTGASGYNRYFINIGKGPDAVSLLRTALKKAKHPGSKELIRRQLEVFLRSTGDERNWNPELLANEVK